MILHLDRLNFAEILKIVSASANIDADIFEKDYIESIRRKEEYKRIGGVSVDIEIKDFAFFKDEFSDNIKKAFLNMQEKYILADRFMISIEELSNALKEIKEKLISGKTEIRI